MTWGCKNGASPHPLKGYFSTNSTEHSQKRSERAPSIHWGTTLGCGNSSCTESTRNFIQTFLPYLHYETKLSSVYLRTQSISALKRLVKTHCIWERVNSEKKTAPREGKKCASAPNYIHWRERKNKDILLRSRNTEHT